jgi:hypothetical protein
VEAVEVEVEVEVTMRIVSRRAAPMAVPTGAAEEVVVIARSQLLMLLGLPTNTTTMAVAELLREEVVYLADLEGEGYQADQETDERKHQLVSFFSGAYCGHPLIDRAEKLERPQLPHVYGGKRCDTGKPVQCNESILLLLVLEVAIRISGFLASPFQGSLAAHTLFFYQEYPSPKALGV